MSKFTLKRRNNIFDSESEYLGSNYNNWRSLQKDKINTFFQLYKSFFKYLPELKTGALALYLFYGFHSDNDKGNSWHSIDTIARELDTTERSINNWNKVLTDLGLILRVQGNTRSKITYLLPLSDYVVKIDENIKKFIDDVYRENIDGELVAAYHLFQWRKRKGDEKYDVPYNLACFVFEKTYKSDKEPYLEYPKRKFVTSNDLSEDCAKIDIEKNPFNINQDGLPFKSHFLEGIIKDMDFKKDISEITTTGIAIKTSSNLKERKDLIDVLSEIRNNESDLDYSREIELIDN